METLTRDRRVHAPLRALVILVCPLWEYAPEEGDAAETCAEEEGGYADGLLERALTLVNGLILLLLLFLRSDGLACEMVVAEVAQRMTREGAQSTQQLTWRLIDARKKWI